MSGVPCSLRSNLANHQKAFSSSKSCRMAFWAHCTLSRMISYLLLLNEHKKTLRFWFRVSMTQLQYIIITTHPYFITPFFPLKVKRPTPLLTLHLVFTFTRKKKYDACWTRCLNQIYENTNLHLLSVWRGFPYRNKGLGFPKPKHEVQFDSEITPNQSVLYDSL